MEQIPQPPVHLYGWLGNLPDIDPSFLAKSFWRLHDLYGDIFQLDLIQRKIVVISSYELAKPIMDDEKFEKVISGGLIELRPLIKDGLFSAFPHEPNWHKAHRTLMPVFGPMGVRKMFPEMLDIASQMILRWDRLGPDNRINTADDFTRLAFDTIGICAFNYRFNNFYAERMHPFAGQMADALVEAGKRANRTSLETRLRIWSAGKFTEDVSAMHKLCDDIVADRKAHPKPEVNDLLNVMLNVADPVTGEKLDDENIRFQMVTFLIAGHETTSGTLAYTFYNLLKHPDKLHKAQQEVDEVLGDSPLEVKHLNQLKYVDACLKETLRLNGPINVAQRHAKADTVLCGKYAISKDMPLVINYRGLHTDPKVWGEDAKVFKPERMLDFSKIPPDAFHAFGIGIRSCIGRAFAEQEMIMNIALILQRFQVEMDDPTYELRHKSTLTIKPDGFAIRVRRRPGKGLMVGLGAPKTSPHAQGSQHAVETGHKAKMTILYGSNAGTTKAFAEDLQTKAPEQGFDAEVLTLDQATENIPKGQPVVVISSSYEGKPPDNAKKFVAWLESAKENTKDLEGVTFATFGCGNSEWASTYHRIPRLIEDLLKQRGATTVCEAALADVKSDCSEDWEKFTDTLWKALSDKAGSHEQRSQLHVNVVKHDAPSILGGQDISEGLVKSVRSLGGKEVGPEKREVEVRLPEGVTYQTGDYLSILPFNHQDNVRRALRHFELHSDDLIDVSGTRKSYLQFKEPVLAALLFSQRVELNAPPTSRQLETLLAYDTSDSDKASITTLLSNFHESVTSKNYSILDILEDHPSIQLPLSLYIDMLKPLTPRQYSISSSALELANHDPVSNTVSCTITYDVHQAPARSGGDRTYYGVASSYLANLRPGNKIHCTVRRTNAAFHLPADPKVPVIMIAAGTGIAPMRGFIEERAAIGTARGKQSLGPALLYFGCRDFEKDYIYKDELAGWEKSGAVSVRMAYSKRGPDSDSTYKYTGDRLWAEREEIATLFRAGAKIYLCGSLMKLAKSTAETMMKIFEDATGKGPEESKAWWEKQREVRYVQDVFD